MRGSVPILRILAIKTPQEMAVQAQKLIDKGYRYLKIKVHGDVEEDVARVAADPPAGRRRRASDHRRQPVLYAQGRGDGLNRMAEYNIDLVEQPVPVGDDAGLALVTDMVPVTVEADEAAGSLAEIYELVSRRDGRCGKPQGSQARRLAQHARGGAHLRSCRRQISPRRRRRQPAADGPGAASRLRACRASIMPANSASSTGCWTIRSRGSRWRTACSSCRRVRGRACGRWRARRRRTAV